MKQAIHILKKDAQYLWKELLLILALSVAFAWVETRGPDPTWVEILLPIAMAYTAARLIHAETVPGDRQFWVTRPYRWKSLLAAKLLGLFLFTNLPLLLARAYVIWKYRFPVEDCVLPLLWSQALLYFAGTLPVAALAAITAGLVPFVFSILLMVAAAFLMFRALILPPSRMSVRTVLAQISWVWDSMLVATIVAFAITALYLQYRHRNTTLSRMVIGTILFVGGCFYVYTPWPAGAAVQTMTPPNGFDAGRIGLQFEPAAKYFFPRGMQNREDVQLDVPIAVRGVPDDVELLADVTELKVVSSDGAEWSPGPFSLPALAKTSAAGNPMMMSADGEWKWQPRNQPEGSAKAVYGSGPFTLNANVDLPWAFFERAEKGRVRISGAVYFTAFGDPRRIEVPVKGRYSGNGMQCAPDAFRQYRCSFPFRWPDKLLYMSFDDGELVPFTRLVSYSPMPAGMELFTVETRRLAIPTGAKKAAIEFRRRLGSFRREFLFEDYPMAQFSQMIRKSSRRE